MCRRAQAAAARPTVRGWALVEALAALALAAIAGAGLAAAAATAAAQVRLEREHAAALWLALARLESLRAGPRESGTDHVVAEGAAAARRWMHEDGRGLPDAQAVRVAWRERTLELRAEAWP